MKKREPGFYWVVPVGWSGCDTIAYFDGKQWSRPGQPHWAYLRIRKVLSGRLRPPGKGDLPQPLENVLLEEPGKSYRTALRILKSNHATGTVYVSRR